MKLSKIEIKESTFPTMLFCKLEYLPQLQNLHFAAQACCVSYDTRTTSVFSLKNLPRLQIIHVAASSFYNLGKVIAENTQAQIDNNTEVFKSVYLVEGQNALPLQNDIRNNSKYFPKNSDSTLECYSSLDSIARTIKSFKSSSITNPTIIKLDFSDYKELREIIIDDYSFPVCKEFKVINLPKLKTIAIGKFCFGILRDEYKIVDNPESVSFGGNYVN